MRNSARAWFDAAIWSGVGLDIQAATVKAITAMERMARSVSQTAEQQEANAQSLRDSITTIHDTSQAFQQTYASFGGEIELLPGKLSELTEATSAAVETIQAMIPVGERAISGLDVSVAAFRSAVESSFVEAAKSHQTATENLVDSVGRISESTIQLKVSSGDLQDTVNAHSNSFKNLNRSLNKQVLPAHEAFLAAISKFNGRGEGVLEQLDELHSDVVESIGQITSLAPSAAEAIAGFSASSAAFSDAVQHRFAPAADEHRENTDKLSASIDKLQKSTQGLADGETAAGDLVRLQTRLSEELGTVQESLRLAVDRLAETGADLNQSLVGDVAPSQRSLREAAKSVSDSAARLSVFVQKGIDPATKRLHRLDETLQRLTGTVDAIRDFSGARQDIENLGQSLSRAAAVSDAIAALPEQIREILEQVARTHQHQVDTQSRGGMMGWLRGRRSG